MKRFSFFKILENPDHMGIIIGQIKESLSEKASRKVCSPVVMPLNRSVATRYLKRTGPRS